MTKRSTSVPELFAKDVIKDLRVDFPEADAKTIRAAIEASLTRDDRRINEARYYYALCERAWLHWSRHALDFITTHALQQATNGSYNPPQIRTALEAAAAHSRCGLHLQLLDVASNNLDGPDWPWQLEAARHVTTATEKALAVAARLDPHEATSARDVRDGISNAADAFTAAIRGGFIADPADEVAETMRGMVGHQQPTGER